MKRAVEGDDRAAREQLARLLDALARRPRPVHVVAKAGVWHQRAAAHALRLVTLGGQRTYLTEYVTTLGHTIFVPEGFDRWPPAAACEVLRHEMIHVHQFERFGWPAMIALYGLLPLPFGLAWGRARLEWQAYRETLRAVADLEGLDAARSPALRASIVRRFVGPDYAWMWPFPRAVERWVDEALVEVEAELARGGGAPFVDR